MKKLVTAYTFDASQKKITFGEDISLEGLLLITNVTTNTIIYNFANSSLGGALSGSNLTLDYNTSAMTDGDELQIYYDNGDVPASQELQHELVDAIKRLAITVCNPPYVDKSANQLRAQVTGAVTMTSTSLVNIDSIQGKVLMNGSSVAAWATSVRNLIV